MGRAYFRWSGHVYRGVAHGSLCHVPRVGRVNGQNDRGFTKSAAQLSHSVEKMESVPSRQKSEIAKRDGQIAELRSTKPHLGELIEDFDRQSKPKLEIVGVREGSDDDSHIVQIRNVSRDDVQAYVLLTDVTPPVRSAVLPIRLDYVHEYGSGGHKFLAPGEVANVDVLHSRDNERFQIHGGGGVIQLPGRNFAPITLKAPAGYPRADPVVRKFDIRLLPQGMVFFQENVETMRTRKPPHSHFFLTLGKRYHYQRVTDPCPTTELVAQ